MAWGKNTDGQAGVPAGLSNVVAVGAGSLHSVALQSDGSVAAWGSNALGQLNVPAGLGGVAALSARTNHVLGLKGDGTVVAWGYNAAGQASVPGGLANVMAVAAGASHSLAVVGPDVPVTPVAPAITGQPANATVTTGQTATFTVGASGSPLNYQWRKGGNNLTNGGNLSGVTSATLTITNVQAGDAGSYDVVVSNTAGSVTSATMSLTVNAPAVPPSITVRPASQLVAVGGSASISVTATGATSYVWKRNGSVVSGVTTNTLNLSSATLADRGLYEVTVANANGSVRSLFYLNVSQTGVELQGWGDNAIGQITIPVGLTNLAQITAGVNHSVALKGDGTVTAWGDNSQGQTTIPAGLSNVVAIAAGTLHTLALKSDGTVVAWGSNGFGQAGVPAGLSNVVLIAAGGYHNLALKNDGSVVAWGRNEDGQGTVPANLGNVIGLAAGTFHSLAAKSDGTVTGWGKNADGQATVPAGLANVVAVGAGSLHSVALKNDGTVVSWGSNALGQLNVLAGLGGVAALSARTNHVLGLKSDGSVIAWGYNAAGQASVPGGLANVMAVAAGASHSLAVVVGAGSSGPWIDPFPVARSSFVVSGFTIWQQSKFTSTELANPLASGADAVYGTDGLTNLTKYALGLEPKVNEFGELGETHAGETEWIFVYPRPAGITDVVYTVEVSTDQVHWTAAGVAHERVSVSGGWELWEASYPRGSGSNAAFRIVVTRR
jgi:alpha-tubulin suppressor-like RCC1 family protein